MPYNPKQPIVIFDGGKDGYGDAVKHPDRSSYNWNYNWDDRYEGRSVPALAPIKIAGQLAGKITTMFEWEDATTFRPLILIGSGEGTTDALTFYLRDGTYASDGSDTSTSAPVLGGVLFRHDGATADNECAYFARGSAPGTTATIWQRTKAAAGGESAAYSDTGHTISPYGVYVVGSQLWIVSANGYEVQKWTLDTDPGLSGSYGTAIPCGRPTYPVNYIANLGGSPLIIKGDMVMKYDPSKAVSEFISVLSFAAPHKENGRATTEDGRGRIYVPSVDGQLTVITPGFLSPQTPTKDRLIDRDTPYGRITAMACDLDWVFAAIEPGQQYTAKLGMYVVSDDGGSRTIHEDQGATATKMADGQFSTVADVSALANAGADYIYVGADEPFLGAYFIFRSVSTNATTPNPFAVGYSSAAATFTSAANSHDSTSVFSQDGLITMQVAGNTDVYASGAWIKTTAYSGSASKYWMRIEVQSALTSCNIAEVRVVPYRPPLDTAVFPETAYAIGGALPVILAGQWRGESMIWHHAWTLDGPRVEKMLVANGSCGGLAYKRALYMATAEGVYCVPVGPDAHPARAAHPKLADYSESSVGYDTHAKGCSAIDFGQVVRFSKGLEIDMTAVQNDDAVRVYCRWDEDAKRGYQKIGENLNGHKFFTTAPPEGSGRILYTYLQYTDGSRTPMAPILHSVTIPVGAWAPTGDTALAEENLSIAAT